MTYFVVLDTNVLVSALLKATSIPDSIVQLALDGIIKMLFDVRIVDEYREVLNHPKFPFDQRKVNIVITSLTEGEFL